MGQVFDLAGHSTFEHEQRGFETAVRGIITKKKEFDTKEKQKKGQFWLQTEGRVVVKIYQMDGLLR